MTRELASFAAYALFAFAGGVAVWSLRRDLSALWRMLQGGDPW